MEKETMTLVVGLAGIGSTIIVSGLGLYFTAKSRSTTFRQSLYDRQLSLLEEFSRQASRARVYETILSGEDETYKALAREDLGEITKALSALEGRAAVTLPIQLWVEVKSFVDFLSTMVSDYDRDGKLQKDSLSDLVSRIAKALLLARTVVGVDEFTEETLSLSSSSKGFERLASIELEHFQKIYAKVNTSKV